MKVKEFETAKGKFLLADVGDADFILLSINGRELEKLFSLKECDSEDASGVIDGNQHPSITAIEIIIKSLGVHLYKNPYPDAGLMPSAAQSVYREAEQITFYNPVVFKIKDA